ncbi:molybdopterin-synthase adenylyltransferase MoeB [uncultured Algoriphagus sp.]|uniref:molybdopterin-synthase adenylyltransferase MoeB n=1 Tax=uncultured Algoriphagus sp. TaxID=417365 RepID=UPI0030EB620B|tara:strand:- start:20224 stop:21612 length:1389 start_codon:yes stop_codon:yes gene_type:complete
MASVYIPTPLRKFTNNTAKVEIQAKNVDEVLINLSSQFPEMKKHLYTSDGKIPSFINIFVGEDDIRNLEEGKTALTEKSVVSIVPAIAGGIDFSKEELVRYNRHIIIPEFGIEAQKKLKNSKVLVIGSGGLGSPMLLYLAAAGIGTIGIVDFDIIDDSNLQRQVLYGIKEVGQSKVESAKKRLTELNPYITINTYNERFTSENALEIVKDYDIVADGTDNFQTRYLVNDACVLLDKPNVYASIFQFEGQVSVFNYLEESGERGPNYRDLYAYPPPPGLVPSCAEGGVLGVLPGIIGSIQALEVIKVASGVGDVLSGRFFTFDALTFQTRTLKFKKNPENPISGQNPSITELIDYEEFCGLKTEKEVKEISVEDLHLWMSEGRDFQLIDVREPYEYDIVNIGADLLPLSSILDQSDKIASDKKVVVHCKMGGRSKKAIMELEEKYGFNNLYNLKGGVIEYIAT